MHNDTINITKEQLKTFLVNYQGLSSPNEFEGKNGVIKLFERIGAIQFDPLNIIGKNADLVLQSRIPNYRESMLTEMLYKDRTLIDGWDKMMSIYLTKDYPYFHFVREHRSEEIKYVLSHRKQSEAFDYINDVIDFINKFGPTYPKDIDLGSIEKGMWGHGKISSIVCDYLWNIGCLGIVEKNNVIKKYDLIERLIDKELLESKSMFLYHDFLKWYTLRKIRHIGIYWGKTGPVWYNHFTYKEETRKQILEELITEGKLIHIKVDGIKEDFYIRKEDIPLLNRTKETIKKVKFIAPLDNILWDRKLLQKIFDFEYTWEVYVPEEKRKYGYYVIPVLYGEQFIARFEPGGNRSTKDFHIKNWWWEEGIEPTKELIDDIISAFNDLTDFIESKHLTKREIENSIKNK